jgi:hypothetical protein
MVFATAIIALLFARLGLVPGRRRCSAVFVVAVARLTLPGAITGARAQSRRAAASQ